VNDARELNVLGRLKRTSTGFKKCKLFVGKAPSKTVCASLLPSDYEIGGVAARLSASSANSDSPPTGDPSDDME
jgi:hypothetical protein